MDSILINIMFLLSSYHGFQYLNDTFKKKKKKVNKQLNDIQMLIISMKYHCNDEAQHGFNQVLSKKSYAHLQQ